MKPKDKKIRFGKLVHLGCIVCKELGFGWTPPEIHHLKGYQFSSMASVRRTKTRFRFATTITEPGAVARWAITSHRQNLNAATERKPSC